jgi:hypothetical protein
VTFVDFSLAHSDASRKTTQENDEPPRLSLTSIRDRPVNQTPRNCVAPNLHPSLTSVRSKDLSNGPVRICVTQQRDSKKNCYEVKLELMLGITGQKWQSIETHLYCQHVRFEDTSPEPSGASSKNDKTDSWESISLCQQMQVTISGSKFQKIHTLRRESPRLTLRQRTGATTPQ